jgi:hypothetical protein
MTAVDSCAPPLSDEERQLVLPSRGREETAPK